MSMTAGQIQSNLGLPLLRVEEHRSKAEKCESKYNIAAGNSHRHRANTPTHIYSSYSSKIQALPCSNFLPSGQINNLDSSKSLWSPQGRD
eukprot:1086930-Pelagomonas_calceolata.AAC.2